MDSNSSFNNFSIVIPIYNEEEILAESINNILSICERTSVEYEIIISENGSTDNTKNLARDFEQNNSKIHINLVISTQDLFDTELLLRIEKTGNEFKEVPAKINEIRPSVSVIYKRIPRTLKSLFKLKIAFYKESLKTKNL